MMGRDPIARSTGIKGINTSAIIPGYTKYNKTLQRMERYDYNGRLISYTRYNKVLDRYVEYDASDIRR